MIQKSQNFLNKKNVKIAKGEHDFNGYASTYNVEILNSFKPYLQIKDAKFTIRSKLIQLTKKLLTKLKDFKLVTKLVLGLN